MTEILERQATPKLNIDVALGVKHKKSRRERHNLIQQTRTPADMTGALLDSVIAAARASMDDEQFGHWLRARVVRQPWRADARNELVRWLDQHGSPEEAAHARAVAANWP